MKPLNKTQINQAIKDALKNGNWIIRADNDGTAYGGFQWNPVGVWTVAEDWNPKAECGGGLHGQDVNHGGYVTGKRVVFCDTKGRHVIIGDDKVKVKAARILMVGLPKIKKINGSLSLSGCDLKGITLPQSVGGSLDLRGCDLKGITLPQSVGGSLYLSGCDLKGITLPQSVGGSLYLSGCDLTNIEIPKKLQSKVVK
jgi:hypothetical protein